MNDARSGSRAIMVITSILAAPISNSSNNAIKAITVPNWARLILWPGLEQRARD